MNFLLKFFWIPILVLAFAVYWFTKPPSILWIDSGTMIAAVASLGIPNPPGFPFYMMASHLFTKIPFANILTRLELFTIVFSLALLFIHYHLIRLIVTEFFANHLQTTNYKLLTILTPAFGTIALAFSYQYWSQTQNTESFIFSYFFVTLFAYLMHRILILKKNVFQILLLTAILYGLAAGTNPTTAAMVPGVLYTMYIVRKSLDFQKLAVLGLTFAITISIVYAYLPIRAKTYPFVNWGNPQTVELFIGHLHGEGLNINEPGPYGSVNGFTGSPLVFAQSVSYWFLNTFYQFTPILWPLILIGAYQIFKKSRQVFILLIVVPAFNATYSGIYLSGNQESWFILSWIFFAIFIAIGFLSVASKILSLNPKPLGPQSEGRGPHGTVFWLYPTFLLCFLPLIVFFLPLNRSKHNYSSDYAYNLYAPLEKDAILIGTGDFFDALSHYLHVADIYRPDVTPVTANVFYVNKWNRDTIRNATNLSVSGKLESMIQYKTYSEYNEVMNQFITENIDKHPIYVTHLTLRASALAGTTAGQLQLDERYKFVPHGLSLKVVRADDPQEPNPEAYDFQFKSPLTKVPFYLERNYKGAFNNILNDYIYGLESLGDWYAEKKDDDNALKYYYSATNLSEKNAELFAHIADFYATRGDLNAAYQYYEKARRFDVNNIGVHFNLGVVYENLGRTREALLEFETVKILAKPDEEVYKEAEKMQAGLALSNLDDPEYTKQTQEWQEIRDEKNNFSLKIPPNFEKRSKDGDYATLISDNLPGSLGLVLEVVGEPLKINETIEDRLNSSKLILPGQPLDIQKINFSGYIAAVQIYGTKTGESSQRFILSQNGWVWQIKTSPGNSQKLSLVYPILSTFKPIKFK